MLIKAFNLVVKVHQNGASTDARLVSSTLQEPVHLVFMLHACSEWPCTVQYTVLRTWQRKDGYNAVWAGCVWSCGVVCV